MRNSIYHVVCHDCTTELLAESEAEAYRHAQTHAASLDHDVEFARVGTRYDPVTADD